MDTELLNLYDQGFIDGLAGESAHLGAWDDYRKGWADGRQVRDA